MRAFFWALLGLSLFFVSCELTEPESTNNNNNNNTPNAAITVSSPNGGESIVAGSSYVITWTGTTTSNLVIDYTTDNGAKWITITSSAQNTGSFTWSPVPNTVSDLCKIRITTKDSLQKSDYSDKPFKIAGNPNKSLALVKPNGGEVLSADKSFDIKWVSTGLSTIKLDFTTNSGISWNSITSGYPADSSHYLWTPGSNLVSSNCLIRISDTGSDTLEDVSNASFSISIPQTITVTSPNGKEQWAGKSSQTITWESSQVSSVKIEYTTDNGVNWTTLTESTPSSGYYKWDPVPSTPSTISKVRISDADDGFPSDESDGFFSLIPETELAVISPNGGEYWLTGSSNYIRWTTAGASTVSGSTKPRTKSGVVKSSSYKAGMEDFKKITNPATTLDDITKMGLGERTLSGISTIKIEYSVNNGATWNTIVESTPNNGSYLWQNIPSQNSALCKIRISDSQDGLPFDISDNSFSMYDVPPQDLTLTVPNGGEVWEAGTSQDIKWNGSGLVDVKLEYSTNNGLTWNVITERTPSDGYFNWAQVPASASTNCRIRVSDADDGAPYDISNSTFTIAPEPGISVLNPNGGESILSGTDLNVTWSSTNIANVKIEYTTNNGANWTTITESTPSDGLYTWTNVPNLNSSLCMIRISDAADGSPSDKSDNSFTIYNQVNQVITLTSPNGKENWEAGTSQQITWTGSGINSVKIEYTTNNGQSWIVIAAGVSNSGAYDWNPVPNTSSTQCKVRVSDAADGSPADESNSAFTIKPVSSIVLTTPNGGENWLAGELNSITWSSTSVENVKIEYTSDNGAYWQTLVASTPSDGSYEASFTVPSNLYKVKISDASDGSPTDESNGTFTVAPGPQIKVTSPNGGENWLSGTSNEIRWQSTNIANVKIEYTTNNGATWMTVVNSTPSNGIYTWQNLPDHKSDLCKIKISDANDGAPSDVSDGFFSMHKDKMLRVQFPNNGEYIWQDTLITWTTTGVNNVNIEYSTDNGYTWNTIISNYHSTGAYYWHLPMAYSTLARIRVTDASDASVTDMSDSYFNLGIKQGISILNNGDDQLVSGSKYTVKWKASPGVKKVKIEYSTDNARTWQTAAASVANNPKGVNSFTLSNIPAAERIVIKVSDSAGRYSAKSRSLRVVNRAAR